MQAFPESSWDRWERSVYCNTVEECVEELEMIRKEDS